MKQVRTQQTDPQETTRLLADTVRLAHNTEYIGWVTIDPVEMCGSSCLFLIFFYFFFRIIGDATLEELRNQGDTLYDSRRNVGKILSSWHQLSSNLIIEFVYILFFSL